MRPAATKAPAGPRGWRAYHLFYHADLDLPLRRLVAPLCAELLAEGEIAGFYFVRYGLGGPHLRLRARPLPGRAAAVDARVRAAADAFLARHPSPAPLPDDAVRRQNRQILAGDPGPADAADLVVADNTLRRAPVDFEVERYGGARLVGRSIDLFSLSSLHVLGALSRGGESTSAARLAAASRAMVRLAWGLARDADGVGALAGWAVDGYPPLAAFAAKGDEAFERAREAMCARVRGELAALAEGDSPAEDDDAPAWLGGAGAALARAIEGEDERLRWRIAWSQLHMTANRFGLRNPEEVYLGRMLRRAVDAVAEAEPGFWHGLRDAHRSQRETVPSRTLGERTRDALAAFAARAEPAA